MNNADFIGEEWIRILNMLPIGLEDSEYLKLALRRRREIRSGGDLLRMCLAYGMCDLSLRQTAAWAAGIGLGNLSDVAVLKRLRQCAQWLGYVVAQWLFERGLAVVEGQRPVRLVDATVVRSPGQVASDYRVHVGVQLAPLRLQSVEVTTLKGGEHLDRHSFTSGEIVVADRGYAHAAGIASVLGAKADVVVRMHWRNLPLYSVRDSRLDVLALLQTLGKAEFGDWAVTVRHQGNRHPLRLIAVKKTAQAAAHEQKRLKRHAQKHGLNIDARSLEAARYFYVLTSLDQEEYSAAAVLELYRMRWQIELVFKRLKSLLHLDDLRAKDEALAQTYIFSKLLGALIVEELAGSAVAFFPWGFPLLASTAEHLAAARPNGAVFMQCDQGDDSL